MKLKDYISKRKSTRAYLSQKVDRETLCKIVDFIDSVTPLYPDIKVKADILDRKNVKSLMSWLPPQLVAIYSEKKDGYLENIGFMFQQLDLYLHSLGLASCWVGLGKPEPSLIAKNADEGLDFVILLAFGIPEKNDFRTSPDDFRRKALCQISDSSDICLDCARLAPSSVNSQPWYFVKDGDIFHAYCVRKNIISAKVLKTMNLIDMGIALSHIYVSNYETFKFYKNDSYPAKKNADYIGSFAI